MIFLDKRFGHGGKNFWNFTGGLGIVHMLDEN